MTVGADGLGLISYYETDEFGHEESLKVAHCSNAACSSATTVAMDGDHDNQVGSFSSITIGPDGHALISYYDRTNSAIKIARCREIGCGGASWITMDGDGIVSYQVDGADSYTSVRFGVDGLPLVAYRNAAGRLMVTHCSNVFCLPNVQLR